MSAEEINSIIEGVIARATIRPEAPSWAAALAEAEAAAVPPAAWLLPPVDAADYPEAANALVGAALGATRALRRAASAGAPPADLDALLIRAGDPPLVEATCGAAIATDVAGLAGMVNGELHAADRDLGDEPWPRGFGARPYPFIDTAETVTPPNPAARLACPECYGTRRVALPCAAVVSTQIAEHAPAAAGLDLPALRMVVAGGFLSTADPIAAGCDLDLWLVGHESPESAAAAIAAVAAAVFAHDPGARVMRSRHAVTFVSTPGLGCPVQVILRPYRSVAEVVSAFDIGAAAVAWDGRRVLATPLGLLAAIRSTVVVDFDRVSAVFSWRLAKYFARGYAVLIPGFAMPPDRVVDGVARWREARVVAMPGGVVEDRNLGAALVLPALTIFEGGTTSRRAAGRSGAWQGRRAAVAIAIRASVATRRADYPIDAIIADRNAIAAGTRSASTELPNLRKIPRPRFDAAADAGEYGGYLDYRRDARVLYRNIEAVRRAERQGDVAPGSVPVIAEAALAGAIESPGGVLAIEPEFDPEFIAEVATHAIAAGKLLSARAVLGFARATLRTFAEWDPADVRAVSIGRAALLAAVCQLGAAWPDPTVFARADPAVAAFGGAVVPAAVWLGEFAAAGVAPPPAGAPAAPDAIAVADDDDAPMSVQTRLRASNIRIADGDARRGRSPAGDVRDVRDANSGDESGDESIDENG